MKKSVYVLFVLLFTIGGGSFVLGADINLEEMCTSNADCSLPCEVFTGSSDEICYCGVETLTCMWQNPNDIDDESVGGTEEELFFENFFGGGEEINDTNVTEVTPSVDQQVIDELQEEVSILEASSADLESRVMQTESNILVLQQQINDLNDNIQLLNSMQGSIEGDVQENTVGLAGLQEDVEAAQAELKNVEQDVDKERAFTKFLTVGLFALLVFMVAFFGIKYVMKSKGSPKVHPEVKNYITKHIAAGKKFPHIKSNLVKAGWHPNDVQWAYKETMRHNYKKYKKAGSPRADGSAEVDVDIHKVAFIAGFSILVLVGVFFILKGATGHAVYFQSEAQLHSSMKAELGTYLTKNAFYDKVDAFHICVQTVDGPNSASYHVVKTPGKSDLILRSKQQCETGVEADYSVKFNSWQAFQKTVQSLTCGSIEKTHKSKRMYVLPSEYVLSGFIKNPEKEYSQYCKVLQQCFTSEEISSVIGINC